MLMSKGQWKDFFIEIKKSLSRYVSIMFMVALGTAFFIGLRSSEPDMQGSLDTYMDQVGYMNIRVLGTLGMTDADVEALRGVEGVTDARGMYTLDVLSDLGDSPKVIHVQSIAGRINQLQLDSGRLPELPDECVADRHLCEAFGLKLGDRITVYSGTDDPLEDSLAEDTFIITGIGISPDYLTGERGSANIGTGSITGFIAVEDDAFTTPAYTQVYVRADWLDRYNCFSDEYEAGIEELTGRIEAIAGQQCEIRYLDVTEEAGEQLADARKELEDAKAEADEEFADAWEQILDGKEQIQSGWDEFNASKEEFDQGKAEYESGLKSYYENLVLIEDGERQIAEAKALLDEKEAELKAGQAQLDQGWAEYNEGKAQLDQAKVLMDSGEAQLALLSAAADAAEMAYGGASAALQVEKGQVAAEQAALDGQKAAMELLGQSWEDDPALVAQQDALNVRAENIRAREQELTSLKKAAEDANALYESSREQLEDGKAQYEAGVAELEKGKAELDAAQSQIDDGARQITEARAQLAEKEKELAAGKVALEDGKKQLDEAGITIEDGETQLEDGRKELEDGEAELNDSIQEYEKAKADAMEQFADAEEELARAERKLAEMEKPEWYILDRNTIQSYVEYDLDGQKIGALADVFPLLFFFVAALVSLTTMTRMVEEQRTLIGTMKALGYSSVSIAAKYILYALSATLAGSLLGVLVGSKAIPWVVVTAYGIMYTDMPVVITDIHAGYSVMATLMALGCTVGATWMACHRALTSQPAALMRPVAPAKGKRILLEHIPFIWKRMSFSVKSTLRNLFRYKKRLFMTLFGIGASMALLLVGYGVQDSLEIIVTRQYGTLWIYDTAVYLEDGDDKDLMAELDEYITENPMLMDWLDVNSTNMQAENEGVTKDITLLVPEKAEKMSGFVDLHHRVTGEHYEMDDHSAYVSEKLAEKLELQVGDTMVFKVDETQKYEATVGAIVENYMQYYVYMSPEAYEHTFDEEPEWNQRLINYAQGVEPDQTREEELAREFLELDSVISVVSSESMRETISTMLTALDYVVVILIGAAALLAFVVLYNLNNINITERKRELATIKLLGFYPGELAAYVYRENIILTALGIAVGLFLGTWLTTYVLNTVEIDMLMFGRGIDPMSYVMASLITAMFSVIVNIVMYFRLQKIDMIESLKSVE